MPMNPLQRQCLEFLKLLREKELSDDLIEQSCYLLMTLPLDIMGRGIDILAEYLNNQNPTESEYRSEMSRVHKELMGYVNEK